MFVLKLSGIQNKLKIHPYETQILIYENKSNNV